MSKHRLDKASSNLVCWKVSLPMARGLELDHLEGLFQHKPFYDSKRQCAMRGLLL